MFLICTFLCISFAQNSQDYHSYYEGCKYEELPDSLNSISYLDFNDELHIHDEFYINTREYEKIINFTIRQSSAFRIYTAPHEMDADLYLYAANGTQIGYSSLDIETEEVIRSNLTTGSYYIKFHFFGARIGVYQPTECDTLSVEIEIVPTSIINQRTASICPQQEQFPILDFSIFTSGQDHYYYSTTLNGSVTQYNVRGPSTANKYDTRWAHSYNFTVPTSSSGKIWTMEVILGAEFIIGDSLGLLLTPKENNDLDVTCYADTSGTCEIGVNSRMNENTLKAALEPGQYSLWIYDMTGEKDTSLSPCIPFSLTMKLEAEAIDETFYNCDAPMLPDVLLPGYDEPKGFVHYLDSPLLDLGEGTHTIRFKLDETSLFRVYTQPHRVDIDLKLLNANDGSVIEYVFRIGGEESIARSLNAGNYSLQIIYYGIYEPVFCETFDLEIAIAPFQYYANTSYCLVPGTSTVKSVTPDFSAMQDYLNAANHTFYLNTNGTAFYFDYQNSYSRRPIISQNFTLLTRSAIKSSLGDNFLTSDLQIQILDDTGRPLVNGTHVRNFDRIEATLEPGQYIFVLSTSPVQRSQIQGFPACAEYTLYFAIQPDTSAPNCWQFWRMPTSLNTVPYLGHNNFIHFVGDYLVPTFSTGSVSATTRTNFTVTQSAFLRVWIEPHEVDIDINLYQDGSRVASTILINVEEEIVFQVQPNKLYQIQYVYYKPRSYDSNKCYIFNSEIALALLPASVPTCSNHLPPTNLIPSYNPTGDSVGQPFYSSNTWFYNQTSSNFNISFPFTLSAAVNFRSYVLYDFAWADLSVRIRNANSTATLLFGEDEYDKNELGPVELSPGSYILEIYEPAAVSVAQYRGCVDFTLTVGYEGVNAQQLPEEFDCTAAFLPVSMNNNPAFLHADTGSKVHWRRNVLANVESRKDTTEFSVTQTSILTIFVPFHSTIDVDITLRAGTVAAPGATIDKKTGLAEETMYDVLAAGSYFLEFKYYPAAGSLPTAASCPTFSMEFSLVPQTYYTSISTVNQACTSTEVPPTSLARATDYGASFHRVPNTIFSSSMSFQVESKSSLLFDLRYQHQVGGLSLQMVGQVDVGGSSPQTRTYHANVGINHAFLYYILEAGSYVVTFYNPYNLTGTPPPFQCSEYRVEYRLDYTNITDSSCENTDPLPSDLYTDAGGSAPFGGPQDSDGSVRIWGDDFKLDETHKHNYIDYKINAPSYIRVFAQSSEDADIDFYFYTNSNRTSVVDFSLGVDSVESSLLALNTQTIPYELDVYLYDLNTDQLCPTFEFELAIKTQATVQSELQCPNVMPSPEVPPSYFNLASDVDLSAEYIFSKSRVESNTVGDVFTYRITLSVPFNGTVVMAAIGYDFLANDFRLKLSDDDGDVQLWGSLGGIQNREDYYNFYSTVYVSLATGTYFLDIVEDLSDKPFNFTQYCHKFDFVLSTWSGHNATSQPYIETVVPAGGEGLTYDPYRDLTIRVSFSESVVLPADQTVLNYVTSRSAAYMYPSNNQSNHIMPGSASFSNSNTRLTLTFRKPFTVGQRYLFIIDGSKFTASNGLTYTSPTQEFSYQMRTCDCNGHGTCNTSATTQLTCSCEAGYAGLDCSQCNTGYHGVGAVCVANTKCVNTTCNGHGQCYDSSGSPVCVCDPGYATTGDAFCTLCAPGYTGYPNCTINDANERNTICAAPLFPPSLDTIEYLGYDGEVHLSDAYFIDLVNYRTEIYFSLQQNSVFRVYVEPHWVDVDLWLYALKDDGTIDRYIDNEIAYNTEEVIYKTLEGQSGAYPKKYMLRLRYFVWDHTRQPDCETVNFEMAIEPTSKANSDPNQKNCAATNFLPPSNNMTFQPIRSDIQHTDNVVYSVRNNNSTVETPNYFYVYDFKIEAPQGKVAILHASVGYRFLTGDLALLLEVGEDKTHCGNSGGYSSNCVQGSNTYNLNTLDEILMDGSYSLWIYEPQPQLPVTNCSTFSYAFTVTFVDAINDLYYCDAVLLPDSFNTPGYLDNSGNMHVFNNFLIEDTSTVFTLNKASYLRVVGDSENSVRFSVYRGSTLLIQSDLSIAPEFFISLAAGAYTFKLTAFQVSEEDCPIVATQITIMPQGTVAHTCPPTELLPNPFPTQSVSLDEPYEFDETSNSNPNPTPFYAFTNSLVIKSTTFTLSETGFFDAYLSSDFLTSNLKFALQFSGSSGERINVNGSLAYNQYYIKQMLQAGTYTFVIYRSSSAVPSGFPPCAEFNLRITIMSETDYDSNTCVAAGEPLPTSLNSIRFLGHDGIFDFQQTQIRSPSFNTFTQEVVKFTVAVPSVMRVYSEPHILDVDLFLYAQGNSTSLTDGGLGFNNEESIIYQVNPGVNYELTLNYWMWDSNPPDCLYFNLEIGISPLSQVSLAPACPNSGADHWPSLTAKTTTVVMPQPFSYNSGTESLYFQQTTTGTRSSPPMNIRILGDDKANLYAEVGYDYVSGDVVMKMVNKDNGDVYYGANTFNGNVLSLTNLAQGNYSITIYEVVETLPSIMGCSNFTFQLYVEVAGQENILGPYPRLPGSLDTVSYLQYDNSVYLQGIYRMFETTSTETIHFTIKTASLMRVATDHQVNELDEVQIVILAGSTVYAAGMETLLETLPPNNYTVQLTKPNGPAVSSLDVDFELSIKTNAQVNSFIAAQPSTCNTTRIPEIKLTPDGYLSEIYTDLTYTNSDMATVTDLQTLTFTVNAESVVYFKLGFDYLLSDLSLTLTSLTNANIQPVPGRNGRNNNDINVVITPGTWSLKVYQPSVFVYSTQYPHCTHYSATLSIEALSEVNDHVDCTTLDILPWDLNSANGGSKPYGGPVNRDGELQMWGTNFYIHHDIDTMYITPTVDSLLNLITKEKYSGEIVYTVKTNTSVSLIENSILGMSNSNQKTSLYQLAGKKTYLIMLDYPTVTRINCPSLAMQISMQPTTQAASTMACPSTLTKPNSRPQLSANGTYSEYVDSAWSRNDITTRIDSAGNFVYYVNLTLNNYPAKVYASMSFNGLNSLFTFSLVRWSGNNRFEIARSEANFQREATGDNTVTQYMAGSITTSGTYSLIITQPPFIAPFVNGTYCIPFQYELVIVPDNGMPYVKSVSPYAADGVNPDSLVLQLEMSEAPYAHGVPATTADVRDAFALKEANTQTTLDPISVAADAGSPLYWTLTFPSLKSATTYQLFMKSASALQNKNASAAFVFQTTNIYTTVDTSCSGHGTYSTASAQCFCESGYGGDNCDNCMPNYQAVNQSGKLVCKQKTGELCLIDSCGCQPHYQQCIPLGACDDSTGTIHCTCPPHYDPSTNCMTCMPGYTGYDNGCTSTDRECPVCEHGHCDNTTKTCVCDGNYAPPTCSSCADGWEGSKCSEKSSSGSSDYSSALEAVRIVEIILACLVLVSTAGFLLYRRYGPRGYQQVEMEFNAIEQDQESPFELDE